MRVGFPQSRNRILPRTRAKDEWRVLGCFATKLPNGVVCHVSCVTNLLRAFRRNARS